MGKTLWNLLKYLFSDEKVKQECYKGYRREVISMKSYSTVVSGREMSKLIKIPDEFREVELKIVVRPVRKKKDRFARLFMNPVRVANISIPSKEEIHER
jgi:hypothetical protein